MSSKLRRDCKLNFAASASRCPIIAIIFANLQATERCFSYGRSLTLALTVAYEALRNAVIDGTQRPEGTAALRYHGMLRGLSVLLPSTTVIEAASPHSAQPPDTLPGGDEFVRLLANLVLRTHSELTHVY